METFSVYGFEGDVHTQRLKYAPIEAVLSEAQVYHRTGQFTRIIITDSGDCINFEWTAEDGVTFPPPEDRGRLGELFPPRRKKDD